MRIAAWNVNSLKVRLPHLLAWLDAAAPDLVGLQETKLTDENFPADELLQAGYHCVFSGQKTYNGVAILSRQPVTDVLTDMPGFEDPQRRVIAATANGVRFINIYVPNGKEIGSDKYRYKLDWLDALHAFLASELAEYPELVVAGDFNIAPDDRDVHDPEEWRGKVLCSEPERAALARLYELGLVDTFRLFSDQAGTYSWWDYRAAAFRRDRGLRIDLVLASTAMAERCTGTTVDVEPRRWERPSDHAPVVATFS